MKKIALLLVTIIALSSCHKVKFPQGDFVQVYKFKDNVTCQGNAYVFLSEDKTKVTSYPYRFDNTAFPLPLCNGYFLHSELSYNLAFLSISKQEYTENISKFNADTLLKLVIEPDPFLEFYATQDNPNILGGICPRGIDSIYINKLIKENNLEKEFTRYK